MSDIPTVATAPIGVIMGSKSDWETMQHCVQQLDALGLGCETRVVSAHRTPDRMHEYGTNAVKRGLRVIIAAAGGAAHLPGMIAGLTPLPVIGVPIQSRALNGLDSLLSIVQMPTGIPVATMSIGKAGAINAALYTARILGVSEDDIRNRVIAHSQALRDDVLANPIPGEDAHTDSSEETS